MISELERLDKQRGQVRTRSGPASYIDTGGPGRPVLFIHGVGTSSYLWRNVIDELDGQRRCVAVDLPLHGHTPAAPGQDLSLPGLARFVADSCDALGLSDSTWWPTTPAVPWPRCSPPPTRASSHPHPDQLRGPRQRAATAAAARGPAGSLAAARCGGSPAATRDIARGRQRFYGAGYEDVSHLPEDIARAMLEPVVGTPERARQFQRLMAGLRARDLLAAEPALRRLQVPTLIVWGTGDRFFRLKWAYWLRDTIPGATEVTEIDGARLFFPDERAAELTAALRRHWDAHP